MSPLPHSTPEEQAQLVSRLRGELSQTVAEQLIQGGEDGLDDKTLRRWLVARKWDVHAAQRDLTSHAAWRVQHMPKGRIAETEAGMPENLKENKTFLQGFDNTHHPVSSVYVKRHHPKSFDDIQRLICYSLDAMIDMGKLAGDAWDGKVVGLLYLTGMTMANYDITGLRAIFDTLQNHYPERLHKMYLYDAPMIFYGLWKIVSPFVDPVTRQKVVFVYPKTNEMLKEIPAEVLPTDVGGTGSWMPIEKAVEIMRQGKGTETFIPKTPASGVQVQASAGASQQAAAETVAVC